MDFLSAAFDELEDAAAGSVTAQSSYSSVPKETTKKNATDDRRILQSSSATFHNPLRTGNTIHLPLVNDIVNNLAPVLGPGVGCIVSALTPPDVHMNNDNACGYVVSPTTTIMNNSSSSFSSSSSTTSSSSSVTLTPTTTAVRINVPNVRSSISTSSHSTISTLLPTALTMDYRKGIGSFIKCDDRQFLDAVLCLPLRSITTAMVLRILVAQGYDQERLLPPSLSSQTNSHQRLDEPFAGSNTLNNNNGNHPYHHRLFPTVPRANFGQFFGKDYADNNNEEDNFTVNPSQTRNHPRISSSSSSSSSVWPRNWVEYHATYGTLLLEEGRSMVVQNALQTARIRLRKLNIPTSLTTGSVNEDEGPRSNLASSNHNDYFITDVQLQAVNMVRTPSEGVQSIGARSFVLSFASVKSDRNSYPSNARNLPTSKSNNGPSSSSSSLGPSLAQMLQFRDFVLIRPNDENLEQCVTASLTPPSSSPAIASITSYSSERTVIPCFLAIVHGRSVNDSNDSFTDNSVPQSSTCNLRIVVTGNSNYPFQTGRSWKLVKLGNLSTLLSQYNSLISLPYTPFAGAILLPSSLKPTSLMNDILKEMNNDTSLDTLPPCPSSIPAGLYRALCRRYDPSQLRVILTSACGGAYIAPLMYIGSNGTFHTRQFSSHQFSSSRTTAEITTVIGPPGTGKTRTVLGIISAFRASLQFPSFSSSSSSASVQSIVSSKDFHFTAKETVPSNISTAAKGTVSDENKDSVSLLLSKVSSSNVPSLPSLGTSQTVSRPGKESTKPTPEVMKETNKADDDDEFIDDDGPRYNHLVGSKDKNPVVINLIDDEDSDGYRDYISISSDESSGIDDDNNDPASDTATDEVDDNDMHPMKELDYLLEDDSNDDEDSLFITSSANSAIQHKEQIRLENEAKLIGGKRSTHPTASISPKTNKLPRMVTESTARTISGTSSNLVVAPNRSLPFAKGGISGTSTHMKGTVSSFSSLKPNSSVRTMNPIRPSTTNLDTSVRTTIKVRILICTPSNAACDEICARLLDLPELPNENISGTLSPVQSPSRTSSLTGASSSSGSGWTERHPGGLLDSNGKPFIPTVIRAGVGGTASSRSEVASVSIERHVQRRLCTLLRRLPITDVGRKLDTQAITIRKTRLSVVKEELGSKLKDLQKDIAQLESLIRENHGQPLSKSVSPLTKHSKTTDLLARVGHRSLSSSSSLSVNNNLSSSSPTKSPRKSSSSSTLPSSSSKIDSGMLSRLRHLKREEKDLTDSITALSLDVAVLIDPRVADVLRLQAIREVLEGCDVLCTTLAGSGQLVNMHTRTDGGYLACLYESLPGYGRVHADSIAFAGPIAAALRFDALIVDEAGQAIEAETLVPLRLAYCGYPGAASACRGALLNNLNNENTMDSDNVNNIGLVSSTLPLAFCRRLVLVGDPLQLPATVLSPAAANAGLPVSLFERLAGANIRPLLLRIQYRMHSMISAFASIYFYRGLVRNALTVGGMEKFSSTTESTNTLVNKPPDSCLTSLLLIDVPYGQESTSVSSTAYAGDPSRGNDAEVAMVLAVIQHKLALLNSTGTLTTETHITGDRSGGTTGSNNSSNGTANTLTIQNPTVPKSSHGPHRGIIGVITFYNEQRRRIKQALQTIFGNTHPHILSQIIVATVDSFQGQEMDHIILSCVRSRSGTGNNNNNNNNNSNSSNSNSNRNENHSNSAIGFVADERRLNVAITRARHSLTVIGNATHLSQHDTNWKAFIYHIRTYGTVYNASAFPVVPTNNGTDQHTERINRDNNLCPHLRKFLK